MKEIEVNSAQLQAIIRDTVQNVLRERAVPQKENASALTAANAAPSRAILVAVCCGECLRPETQAALDELKRAGFVLIEPGAHELKDKAVRERLISKCEAVLLPAVGDDDAAKMALGIFDEPVTRTALAALALGKPVLLSLHSPYDAALKSRSPVLRGLWESYRKTLLNFGFEIAEAAAIAASVQEKIAPRPVEAKSKAQAAPTGGGRKVVTAEDIETAARNGKKIELAPGALITPLARDRARELGVAL